MLFRSSDNNLLGHCVNRPPFGTTPRQHTLSTIPNHGKFNFDDFDFDDFGGSDVARNCNANDASKPYFVDRRFTADDTDFDNFLVVDILTYLLIIDD
mgnify:CR=1 FL=1